MNRPGLWIAVSAVTLFTVRGVMAASLGANIAISADDTGGFGFDADLSLSPPGNQQLNRRTAG